MIVRLKLKSAAYKPMIAAFCRMHNQCNSSKFRGCRRGTLIAADFNAATQSDGTMDLNYWRVSFCTLQPGNFSPPRWNERDLPPSEDDMVANLLPEANNDRAEATALERCSMSCDHSSRQCEARRQF
jgi:hypothetical protein